MQIVGVAATAGLAFLAAPVMAAEPAPTVDAQAPVADDSSDFELLTQLSQEETNAIRGSNGGLSIPQRIVSTLRAALADFLAHRAHGHIGRIRIDSSFNFSYEHPFISTT